MDGITREAILDWMDDLDYDGYLTRMLRASDITLTEVIDRGDQAYAWLAGFGIDSKEEWLSTPWRKHVRAEASEWLAGLSNSRCALCGPDGTVICPVEWVDGTTSLIVAQVLGDAATGGGRRLADLAGPLPVGSGLWRLARKARTGFFVANPDASEGSRRLMAETLGAMSKAARDGEAFWYEDGPTRSSLSKGAFLALVRRADSAMSSLASGRCYVDVLRGRLAWLDDQTPGHPEGFCRVFMLRDGWAQAALEGRDVASLYVSNGHQEEADPYVVCARIAREAMPGSAGVPRWRDSADCAGILRSVDELEQPEEQLGL